MVKITIEYDGKTNVLQGDLFLGGMMTDAGDDYATESILIGEVNSCQLPKLVEATALDLLTSAFKDDLPKQAVALRELVAELVQDYLWRELKDGWEEQDAERSKL